MKFIKRSDFEILNANYVFLEENKTGYKTILNYEDRNYDNFSKESIASNEVKKKAKEEIKNLKNLIENEFDSQHWSTEKQIKILSFLSHSENILDDDKDNSLSLESTKNFVKRTSQYFFSKTKKSIKENAPSLKSHFNTIDNLHRKASKGARFMTEKIGLGNSTNFYEIVTKLSDESLLKFISLYEEKALELFTNKNGNEYVVDFFNIDFLEKNISPLEILDPEEQKYISVGNNFYIRQSNGYLQVKPKTEKKCYAEFSTGTKFTVLSEDVFKKNTSGTELPDLESSETIEKKEQHQRRNFEFYQSMKLMIYKIQAEENLINNENQKKLHEVLTELDNFYQNNENKSLESNQFMTQINDKIQPIIKKILNNKNFDFEKASDFIKKYLKKNKEKNESIKEYSKNKILNFLKTVNPEIKNEEINSFLEIADKLKKGFSEDDVAEIIANAGIVTKKIPTKNFSKKLSNLLKKRHTILFQNDCNDLFVTNIQTGLKQIKIQKSLVFLEKENEKQKKAVFEFFENNKDFCIPLGLKSPEIILEKSAIELQEIVELSLVNESLNERQFQVIKNLKDIIETKIIIENTNLQIKNEKFQLSTLTADLETYKTQWNENYILNEKKAKIYNSIAQSFKENPDAENVFFQKVLKKHEQIGKEENKKIFNQKYSEKLQELSPEEQAKREAFVKDFIQGNPSGVLVIDFNEIGPILAVGEGKQEIQYNIKTNKFSVVGLEDYNKDYLNLPATPESLPTLQIIASFKEANYFTSDKGIAGDSKKLGNWDLEDFFKNYLGVFAGNRLQQPNELDGWKNLMLAARDRGVGLMAIMENLDVVNKHKELQGEKGDTVRLKLASLLEAARVGNEKYLDQFFNRNYLKNNQAPSNHQTETMVA